MIGNSNVQAASDSAFFQAILQNNLGQVQAAVAAGAALDQLDPYGGTPLHLAVYRGNIALARLFLEKGADVNAKINDTFFKGKRDPSFHNYQGTPLHLAAYHGNIQMAKLLVAYGAILNLPDQAHDTPLIVAVQQKQMAFVKWLLKQGATVNDSCSEGLTVLNSALRSGFKMVKLLIDHGARAHTSPSYGHSILDFARYTTAKKERKQIMQLLIKKGARFHYATGNVKDGHSVRCLHTVSYLLDQGALLHSRDNEGNTLLHAAVKDGADCKHKQDDLLETDWKRPTIYATEQNNRALFQAILKGELKKVKTAISGGTSVDQLAERGNVPLHIEIYMGYAKNPYKKVRITAGYTPLHLAAYRGNIALIKLLLKKGANINAIDAQHGYTPLQLAACQGHEKVVQLLIAAKALIDTREKRLGRTALHLAAATGNSATVRYLINHGSSCNSRDKTNWTPLQVAILSRNAAEVIQLLIEHESILNKTADTPLHLATKEKDIASVRYLIQKGATVNATDAAGKTALHFAAKRHWLEGCKLLIEAGAAINHASNKGKTPLYMACGDNYIDGALVEFLIQRGIPVSVQNKQGRTPLHVAICNVLTESIRVLITYGADVNAEDYEKNTPLHLLDRQWCITDIMDIIHLLMANGVEVNRKNKNGKTALQLAIQNNLHSEIITLLESNVPKQ
nr:ankyrin repeat domain-containing protein [Candidatus Cardinium hertigii]